MPGADMLSFPTGSALALTYPPSETKLPGNTSTYGNLEVLGTGEIRLAPSTAGGGAISLANGAGGALVEVVRITGGSPTYNNNGETAIFAGALQIPASTTSGFLRFGASGQAIWYDAADITNLRRTTNPQTLRLGNTWTDASNYEWLAIQWTSNVIILTPEAAGTGTLRGMRLGATGTTIAFLGATPVAQQTGGENLTNSVTAGGTTGTIADITDQVVYANDAAAIRNDIYQLARALKQDHDALRLYGLLT